MLMTNQDDDESVEGDAGPREGAVRRDKMERNVSYKHTQSFA